MNVLLIFFAIPIAVIILSIILETYMKSPLKVAGIFFSIFFVLAVALGGTAELIIASIVYTLISLITAYIIDLITFRRCCRRESYPNFYTDEPRNNIEESFELPSPSVTSGLNSEYDNGNTFNNCYRRYR